MVLELSTEQTKGNFPPRTDLPSINSVDQATDVRQLLTDRGVVPMGKSFDRVGHGTALEGKLFGKSAVLEAMQSHLEKSGAVILEGAHMSGKSSLLLTLGDQLRQSGLVTGTVWGNMIYLNGWLRPVTVQRVREYVQSEIEEMADNASQGATKAYIALDEIEACDESMWIELLDCIEEFRQRGHLVAISVIGSLNGDSPRELPRVIKDKLRHMVGDSVVINTLLDDAEMRTLLSLGGESLFTGVLTDYLLAQAGGHPKVANILAGCALSYLSWLKNKPGHLVRELENTAESMFAIFSEVVNKIIAAGFNPLTWEWRGEGNQPDVEIYKNMIPRPSATIFYSWLSEYLEEQSE